MPVRHHIRCLHPAKRFENVAKIAPGDIAPQITYINIHFVPLSFDSFIPGPQQLLLPASRLIEAALSVLISKGKAVLKPLVATSTCDDLRTSFVHNYGNDTCSRYSNTRFPLALWVDRFLRSQLSESEGSPRSSSTFVSKAC
jgi:hypothetical protein